MTGIVLKKAMLNDLAPWLLLRSELWPEVPHSELRSDCHRLLRDPHQTAFVAWDDTRATGFIEGSLRGSTQQPCGHVEGWYVTPGMRGNGVAQVLMSALEDWFLHHWIEVVYSDTSQDYPLSPKAHETSGYDEVGVIRVFRKSWRSP